MTDTQKSQVQPQGHQQNPQNQIQQQTTNQPPPPQQTSQNVISQQTNHPPQLSSTSNSQSIQSSSAPIISSAPCSVASTPSIVSGPMPQGPRPMTTSQIRPHGEYLVLLSPHNLRQPGVQGLRYPIQAMTINQPGILGGNPALLRSISPSQIIRTSSPGMMQPQTSQAQTTTVAGIQGGHVQIPFSATGPQGQIRLANGQTIIPSQLQRHQMMPPRILQQPGIIRGIPQPGMAGVHQIMTGGITLPSGMSPGGPMIHHTNLMTPSAIAPSQMTPDDALTKGKNFFESLLTKLSQPQVKSKKSIQNLIQALIDGKKTSEEFATTLQKELNSGPQTQLVPFLDLLLPRLRQSMDAGETKLTGIKSPNLPKPPPSDSPSISSPGEVQSNVTPVKKKKVPLAPGQKSNYAIKKEAREAKKKEREALAAAQGIKEEKLDEKKDSVDKTVKPKVDKPKRPEKQKKQERQLESLSSTLRDDDDVNDVAAMGGVNLAEESQKIMASSAELVGTQIRSCRDEAFFDIDHLMARIARITKEHDLGEPSKDVVTLISHATQERMKDLVERLGMLAEQRSRNLRFNPRYEVSNDVKGQMKFLAELDRIEKRRYEEQERELLLRVAKSRSKVEDPEQQKLRQKAKDMQRAQQEEVRQREANETALLAIGPRKKPKLASTTSGGSSSIANPFSQSGGIADIKPSVDMKGDTVRRLKRVNMRDLQVLLELDRSHLNRLVKIAVQ